MTERVTARLVGVWLARLAPWGLLAAALWMVASQVSRPDAVFDMWRRWGEIGAIAAVMTAIVLTGGIDLSVGSTVALCGVVLGLLWKQAGWPIELAAGAAVATGFLAGGLNGSLVVLGIAPLVATLATMACYAGLAMALSRGERIAGLPAGFVELGKGWSLGMPNQFWFFIGILAVVSVVVHHTRAGRYLYALGDNRVAAQFAAVPVRAVQWWLYAASGLVAGLAALMLCARGESVVPTSGTGLELAAIACVVVGGTRVTGGSGGLDRTLLGVAIMSLLEIGLPLVLHRVTIPWTNWRLQINADTRSLLTGLLVILLAVRNEWLGRGDGGSIKAEGGRRKAEK